MCKQLTDKQRIYLFTHLLTSFTFTTGFVKRIPNETPGTVTDRVPSYTPFVRVFGMYLV